MRSASFRGLAPRCAFRNNNGNACFLGQGKKAPANLNAGAEVAGEGEERWAVAGVHPEVRELLVQRKKRKRHHIHLHRNARSWVN